MIFSIGARCIAHSFSIRFGILSGPDAFDGFIFVNSFSMMIGLMLFFDCILVDGRSLFVGILENYPKTGEMQASRISSKKETNTYQKSRALMLLMD
jgi:hypothetical protein